MKEINVQDVEAAIDVPVEQWPGKCYGIAYSVVKAGVVAGTPGTGTGSAGRQGNSL